MAPLGAPEAIELLIDMHSHYLPQALLRALGLRSSSPRILDRDGKTMIDYGPRSAVPLHAGFTDIDVIIQRMDEASIDHSVLSVTIPGVDWFGQDEASTIADECNRETAELCRLHPDRLSGLATVPLQYPDEAADVLGRGIEMGLKGAMIYSNVAGGHLDDPSRRQFFDAAAKLDVPVLLHPTYPLCAPTVSAHGMIEIAASCSTPPRRRCVSCSTGYTSATRTSNSSSPTPAV